MKKTLIAGLLLATFCVSPAWAVIPVTDAASILKTVQEGLTRAKEAAANLEQLKQQYDQIKQQYEQEVQYAKDQKARLEGFTDFSGGFDTASSYLKDSLSDVTSGAKSDLGGLRNEYGLTSTDSAAQARYDGILQKIKFYDNFNTQIRQRADRLASLQKSFSEATTPQKKTDVANQLSAEQMTMDMQIKQYDIAERQMNAAEKARYEKSRIDWDDSHSAKNSPFMK